MNSKSSILNTLAKARRVANGTESLGRSYHLKPVLPQGAVATIHPDPNLGDPTKAIMALLYKMTQEGEGIGPYSCEAPCSIYYCEGSQGVEELTERMVSLEPDGRHCKLYPISLVDTVQRGEAYPSLFDPLLQDLIYQGLSDDGCGILAVDNSASWFTPIEDDPKVDLEQAKRWISDLKSKKITQIYVVPPGEHFKIDRNIVDVSIELRQADKSEDVIQMIWKGKYVDREHRKPLWLEFVDDGTGRIQLLEHESVEMDRLLAVQLAAKGKTQVQIGEIIGRDQATVSRWLKKAEESQLIERNGHNVTLTEKGRRKIASCLGE